MARELLKPLLDSRVFLIESKKDSLESKTFKERLQKMRKTCQKKIVEEIQNFSIFVVAQECLRIMWLE